MNPKIRHDALEPGTRADKIERQGHRIALLHAARENPDVANL